ncbi:mevalonate pyrophosphate decarboxylase [Caulobacter sp. BE264]|nr:mevalonate pyrophosphate decarboxylase [Caulobacter sp. BE264]
MSLSAEQIPLPRERVSTMALPRRRSGSAARALGSTGEGGEATLWLSARGEVLAHDPLRYAARSQAANVAPALSTNCL